MLSKAEYRALQPYSRHLKSSQNGYIRGVYHSDVQAVLPIYTKYGYKLSNPNCADCVLSMFKKLGEMYREYENKQNKK